MIIGCCIDISRYDELVQNGYESIALAAKDVAAWDDQTLQAVKEKLVSGSLKTISLNSFCTADLKLNGHDYVPEKLRDYMERVASRAKMLGFRYIGIGAPASRNLQPHDDVQACRSQFREAMEILCSVAEKYGIEVLLESVCKIECNFITTTKEALYLIREWNLPNLHLVYDIYHEYMEHQTLDVIREAENEIRVVHIAQNKNNQRAYLDWAYLDEYQRYRDALADVGYDGEWNLEAFVGDPEIELQKSIEVIRQIN